VKKLPPFSVGAFQELNWECKISARRQQKLLGKLSKAATGLKTQSESGPGKNKFLPFNSFISFIYSVCVLSAVFCNAYDIDHIFVCAQLPCAIFWQAPMEGTFRMHYPICVLIYQNRYFLLVISLILTGCSAQILEHSLSYVIVMKFLLFFL
jgi:hypothetical protein